MKQEDLIKSENVLNLANFTGLSAYVAQHGGTRLIHRVLLANNGLAAAKEIRSVRKWSLATFGHSRAIHFIAMVTPEDLAANAEYVRLADEYVSVPGGSNNLNYANVRLILEMAERMGVQAVWAGWGHASENPKLPEGLKKLGIQFIGPPAGAMHSLGDKISSMIVAQSASVPCLPWSGSGLSFTPDDGLIESVPTEIYQKACVCTVEEGVEAAKLVGFPLMIKASEGGGGKGIRRVDNPSDFALNFDFVQREVPGSPIFLMQLASTARHLEVQLLADEHGQAISLFGRDCSVQRRHQKIIEESPVTVVEDPEQWVEMERAAVRLAKLVGYVSTGTVEYLYDVSTKRFSFLELNPRLQVEHPCTEMISRVNLPAAQLQVAMGIPLNRIPDIRRLYGLDDVDGDSTIDFDTAKQQPPFGHVIACRITAENPEAGFKPGGGKMTELTFRSFPDVWGYFSIPSSGGIHDYADSQFGHVFAWGKNREEARNNMVQALLEASIRSDFRTIVEYLVKLLETPTFLKGEQTTAWLDGLIKDRFGQDKNISPLTVVAAGAVWHAKTLLDGRMKEATQLLQKGQKPTLDLLEKSIKLQFSYDQIQYTVKATQTGSDRFSLEMNGTALPVHVVRIADGGLLMSMLARTLLLHGRDEAQGLRLTLNGTTVLIEKENDPTVVRSPSPGKLVRYLVEEGTKVPSGTAIAEIEVMKMYMPLTVSEAGVIIPTKQPGSTLEAGEVVARIKLLDPTSVKLTKAHPGGFEDVGPAVIIGDRLERRFMEKTKILENIILEGYSIPPDLSKDFKTQFLAELTDPHLPFYACENLLSNICGRIPAKLYEKLSNLLQAGLCDEPLPSNILSFHTELKEYLKICDSRDAAPISAIITELAPHLNGPCAFAKHYLASLCDRFYQNVYLFDNAPTSDAVLNRLCEANGTNFELSYHLFSSWESGEARQIFFANLLKKALQLLPSLMGDPIQSNEPIVLAIKQLTKLSGKELSRISLGAREALMSMHLPSFEVMTSSMEAKLLSYDPAKHALFISELVSNLSYHLDLLPSFFLHKSPQVRQLALEIYIRRVFEAFEFLETSTNGNAFMWVVAAPPPAIKDVLSSPALTPLDAFQRRAGAFAAFDSEADAHNSFVELIEKMSPTDATKNVVYFSIPDTGHDDAGILERWVPFMQRHANALNRQQIKRVTLLLVRPNCTLMGYYTFREMLDWREDCQVRHIEPAMSYLLELPRMLHNYQIKLCHADPSGQVHIYTGDTPGSPSRLFIRVLIRPMQTMKGHNTLMSLAQDARSIFEEVLDSVALVQSQQKKPLDCNHLYIHMLPTFYADPGAAADMFLALMGATEEKLLKLRVMEGEIRMQMAGRRGDSPDRYRFFLWNETGFVNRVAIYKEVRPNETEKPRLISVRGGTELDGEIATAAHPPLSVLQVKRNRCHALETSYVYDFPAIFKRAVELAWLTAGLSVPSDCSKFIELILEGETLKEVIRGPSENDIGMIAWKAMLKTPDYPAGRPIIIIANDIDFEIGSFGVAEDRLFAAASKFAREQGWPRIFLSANSGARIGIAEELRGIAKARWLDPKEPARGFEYLYLEESDYEKVKDSVRVEYVAGNEPHYKITDILSGLGVENLSGSALIASETSRAYTEAFTLTFVTGRSVGIGAYLVRLGQRVIQKHVQPIILTGVQALNQLLGRDVYASNLQIGGPQIMAANGVSHLVVKNDLEGVQSILKWLEFVPLTSKPGDKVLRSTKMAIGKDDPERPVAYAPPNQPYDPRLLVTGADTEDGVWSGGLLDRGSFVEFQSAWARSVIVGRGRLGGIPVAVLLVETRTTQSLIPADPASPSSESLTIAQAGQVWYPDSAYKTAQFLRDCNFGERLPLLILANWRGFSGGQRDLFDEILKFGSYIVDALREYVPPVFVYLPPGAQLRGGSWVVVDAAINPRKIEMYAEPSARGGIIEAEGIVAIKFRGPKLRGLMNRLVPDASSLSSTDQDRLFTTMHHVACTFADLHDRPGRMEQLGVIRAIVPWRDSRRYFYHRLRVRLWTMQIFERAAHLCQANDTDARDDLFDGIQEALTTDWLPTICIDPETTFDVDIADAMDRHADKLEEKLRQWCRMQVSQKVTELLDSVLSPADKTALLHKLLAEDRIKSASPNR